MATELYPGVFVQEPDADPAPDTAFTVWDDPTAGTDITSQLTAVDGLTAYVATTDAEGNIVPFRGPDGYQGPVFVDTGASIRYMLLSSTVWQWLVAQVTGILATPGGGGGGLPVGTTLDEILDGLGRIAYSQVERDKLALIAPGATALTLGTTATTARRGDWLPTTTEIGAVRSVAGFGRVWGRTAAQGKPTVAEGLQVGDYAFIDEA